MCDFNKNENNIATRNLISLTQQLVSYGFDWENSYSWESDEIFEL